MSVRNRLTRKSKKNSYPLPFLEDDNVGIGAVLAVFAYENVAFVAGDSETATFGTNLFDLVSPVASVIVKELDAVAVDAVFLIDERALQNEEIVDAGHVLNAECIDFFDELLLHGRSGVRQLIRREAPALERREILAEFHLVLFAGKALAGILVEFFYKLRTEFDHLFHREVTGEGAVLVAVDAVFVTLAAIGVRAQDFRRKRHSAALTKFHFHKFSFISLARTQCTLFKKVWLAITICRF